MQGHVAFTLSTAAVLAAFTNRVCGQLTALVDPPSAMTTVIAFSNAARVMMSRGLMSAFSSSSTALHSMPRHNISCSYKVHKHNFTA